MEPIPEHLSSNKPAPVKKPDNSMLLTDDYKQADGHPEGIKGPVM